jgi:hypothetical protein
MIYSLALRLFGDSATSIAEWLGYDAKMKMLDMKAVYWPSWRCDVILEGLVKSRYNGSGQESKGWIGIEEMYVPGQLALDAIGSMLIFVEQAIHSRHCRIFL